MYKMHIFVYAGGPQGPMTPQGEPHGRAQAISDACRGSRSHWGEPRGRSKAISDACRGSIEFKGKPPDVRNRAGAVYIHV